MDAFDDVRFPIALGPRGERGAGFLDAIVTAAGGAEQRNAEWADARLRFDAGPGVRGRGGAGDADRLLPRPPRARRSAFRLRIRSTTARTG